MKIVLADDERIIREGIAEAIDWKSIGCELVGVAADGGEALRALRDLKPECIITDIRMPILSGLDLIRAAHREEPSCRFVILSGYEEFDFAREAMKYGVRDYLLKPVDEFDLVTVLRRIREEQTGGPCETVESPRTGNRDIDAIVEFIHANYRSREISLSWISKNLVFKNTDYLGKLFKERTGKRYNTFLAELRVQKAMEILRCDPTITVAALCEAIGYPAEGSYFCTHFKRFSGQTVSSYRVTCVDRYH